MKVLSNNSDLHKIISIYHNEKIFQTKGLLSNFNYNEIKHNWSCLVFYTAAELDQEKLQFCDVNKETLAASNWTMK